MRAPSLRGTNAGVAASALSLALALAVTAACGSETSDGGSSGASGSSGTLAGDDGGSDGLEGCAKEQRKAEPFPLDLYVMLDTSGSMGEAASPGVTKYKATVDAMNAFFADPASSGVGVGLQFFPLSVPGVPSTCSSSAECPAGSGPCTTNICFQNGPAVFCDPPADCASGARCAPAYQCTGNPNAYCTNLNAPCRGPNGENWGTCRPPAAPRCSNSESCNPADYGAPAVPIAMLPGAASQLAAALAAKAPEGETTPTSAALQAAVDHAKAHASANPTHAVAVLLATDGLPTKCERDIAKIASIASAAANGTPKVRTFVVGVFSASEQAAAKANLDQIAKAGDTSQALVVEAGASTTKELLDAISEIRGAALPCDYNVPVPEAGVPDYDHVNVRHTSPSGTKTVFTYTRGAASCDPTAGGWYYDADPKGSGAPTKIVLCPATCTSIKQAGGQVDVVLGCQTRIR